MSDVRNDARRRLLKWGLGFSLLMQGRGVNATGTLGAADWPEWNDFVTSLLRPDGRIVDLATADQRTTSEAQGYGMFFALVNNDVALFAKMWNWVDANLLSGGSGGLPAWLWAQDADGVMRVLDANSASDADMWIAYSLLEAGRLWHRMDYSEAGRRLLQSVAEQEMAAVPGLGPMVMPGLQGFSGPGWWRFNPSYMPLQLLRRFGLEFPADASWARMPAQALKLIQSSAPMGFVPDWIRWDGQAMIVDPDKGALGSWDAIRTYLWAGMLAATDPLRTPLLAALHGPSDLIDKGRDLPEKMDTRHGIGFGMESSGYAGALLPYLLACGSRSGLMAQQGMIPPASQYRAMGLPYYQRAMILFGTGFIQHRFRFDDEGRMVPAWCPGSQA